jgi:hypothetical protein
MSDFAAAPIQPIVEGLVTFPAGPGGVVVFDGKGVSAIARGASAQGSYILTLDPGLPGNAGAVPFGPAPPLSPDPDVRTLIQPLGAGAPPVTGIFTTGVSYIPSAVTGVGAPQVEVVLTDTAFAPLDPVNGFTIVVWRGLGGGVVL